MYRYVHMLQGCIHVGMYIGRHIWVSVYAYISVCINAYMYLGRHVYT